MQDYKSEGMGIDVVFDTKRFLIETNQIEVGRGKVKGSIENYGDLNMSLLEFKQLILLEEYKPKSKDLKALKEELGIKSKKTLREICRKQLHDGTAYKLSNTVSDNKSDDVDEDDD